HEGAYAMWGVAEKDLWAVGNRTILHGSCGSWSATDVSQHLPSSENGLSAVWGSAGDDVWAVGFGVALHWDGVSWKKVPTPATIEQTSVWGADLRTSTRAGIRGCSTTTALRGRPFSEASSNGSTPSGAAQRRTCGSPRTTIGTPK